MERRKSLAGRTNDLKDTFDQMIIKTKQHRCESTVSVHSFHSIWYKFWRGRNH